MYRIFTKSRLHEKRCSEWFSGVGMRSFTLISALSNLRVVWKAEQYKTKWPCGRDKKSFKVSRIKLIYANYDYGPKFDASLMACVCLVVLFSARANVRSHFIVSKAYNSASVVIRLRCKMEREPYAAECLRVCVLIFISLDDELL